MSGFSKPATRLRSVDFPDPEGPVTAVIAPPGMRQSKAKSAWPSLSLTPESAISRSSFIGCLFPLRRRAKNGQEQAAEAKDQRKTVGLVGAIAAQPAVDQVRQRDEIVGTEQRHGSEITERQRHCERQGGEQWFAQHRPLDHPPSRHHRHPTAHPKPPP